MKEPFGLSVKNTQTFCINCKYFVLRKIYDNYDNSIICETSNCSKFVTKNVVSGRMKEDLAIKCRSNENMCGIDAKYFTSKNSTIIDEHIFIKNDTNTCIDCKFGVPHIPTDPFEERDPIDYNYRCQKFVTTDIVSGKEYNKLANICRSNEKMCGINAKFFIKK
jgi:nitrate/TMAO reductase-like tetraheme cytochrome c subunit